MIGKGATSLCVLTHNVLLLSVASPGSSALLGLAGREHPGVSGTRYNSLPLSKFTHSRALIWPTAFQVEKEISIGLIVGKLSHGEGRDLLTSMDHLGTPKSHGMLGQVGKSVARRSQGASRAGDSLGYLGDVIATVKGHLPC